jgi:hypothetical protein
MIGAHQHAERVAIDAGLAVGAESLTVSHQVAGQGLPERRAAPGVADRVHGEGQTPGQPEGVEQGDEHAHHLGVQCGGTLPERLQVDLVELAVASRLRPLVPEHRSNGVEPDRLRTRVEPVLDVEPKH